MKKTRLNFIVREDVRLLLEDLRERSRSDSLTEVLRRAILVYDWLAACHERGGRVYVEEPDDSRTLVAMPEFSLRKRDTPGPVKKTREGRSKGEG